MRHSISVVNGASKAVDSHVLWGVIRQGRPKRMVEVGSGESTKLAMHAAMRNQESGSPVSITIIDPFPSVQVRERRPSTLELIVERVQDAPLDTFTRLDRGDVHFLYCEVLPRLRDGVLVHVHDISLPRRYPTEYYARDIFWNDQYLLQAFLAFNSRFEVMWPGNWIAVHHHARLRAIFPELERMRRTVQTQSRRASGCGPVANRWSACSPWSRSRPQSLP